MRIGISEELPEKSEPGDTSPPAPDSGRRQRPRDQLATLPGDPDFELHDTIPAPPWLDEPVENSRSFP